ncbi:MAG TPA: ABC transporter substrate-binding protein [Chloroflexota bacterium]
MLLREVDMCNGRILTGLLLSLLAFTACAAPSGPSSAGNQTGRSSGAPKRVVAGIRGTAQVLYAKLNISNAGLGVSDIARMVGAGLTARDDQDELHPQLTEAIPTVNNGNWKLQPDGKMETVWKIRPNARWHDGTAVSADDILFTLTLSMDPDLPVFAQTAFESVDGARALDASTVVVTWKQPYIHADELFSTEVAPPLPKHLLEKSYQEDKLNVPQHPYFTTDFVGTGAFKVKEYVPDSFIVLTAFDDFVLGRPRIDEFEARFVPDANTVLAYLLSGEIQLILDARSITSAQALTIKDQWAAGTFEYGRASWVVMYPQHINPMPSAMADVRFKRALTHAVNREEMGQEAPIPVPIADSWIGPDWLQYKDIESSMVKYPFDLRRSAQLLEEVGYSKGPDGFYRDISGKLNVEIRAPNTDINTRSALTVLDYWQRAGIGGEMAVVPAPRTNDREYRATFPGLELIRPAASLEAFTSVKSNNIALPENNWAGTNRQRYASPVLDTLIDRYLATIPPGPRLEGLKEVVHLTTDQLVFMSLIFDPPVLLISQNLRNVPPANLWNAHEWDVV